VEIIGYIGRVISHNDIWSLGPYIIQSILLLIAPAFFAASIYMTLRRLIILTTHYSHVPSKTFTPIPIKWISRIFVLGDVAAFLLQAGGGGIQAAATLQSLKIGEDIIIAGLFVQIAFFAVFMFTIVTFHLRVKRHGVAVVLPGTHVNWMKLVWMLYAASGLIMVRSVFRVIEYLVSCAVHLCFVGRTLY